MLNTILYSLVVFIWGSTWLAITYQLGVVSPLLSIAYRFLLASALLFAYCRLRGRPLRYNAAAHRWMMLQGLLLFALNYWQFYLAERALASGLVAVVFALMVPLNILNGRLFLGAPIRPGVAVGGLLGLIGVGLIFQPELRGFQGGAAQWTGLLLCLGATLSASLGNIVSARNQRQGLPILQVNAYGMGYGGLFMLLMALLLGQPLTFEATGSYVGSLIYLTVFGSIVAFGSYLSLVGRIGADRAAYTTLLFPIVALMLSAVFEGYQWSVVGLCGLSLILFGNLLALGRIPLRWRPPVTVAPRA